MREDLVIAVPKGRILAELEPILAKAEIKPEAEFYDENSRKLEFSTNIAGISIIRVRAFDVASFVAFGGADIGVVGNDVLEEFGYDDIYSPLDLGIGQCRLSVAEAAEVAEADNPDSWSHIRIATKYPNITQKYFAAKGVQAECIKLNGAMELAPKLGMCHRIVDLVSSGATLKANGLVEIEKIMDVTSRLIVSRTSFKTRNDEISAIIEKFSTNG
ncbi:MAG: ATP phosphoribosyltransferase [Alphaproteobacteria bacterium CG11_big_fil_rev_8_21_14_0_20_44_7]|nr:MAG: ATP phosphoribosyltransferase [Alphaproteobacteria bacterium CG11_big_fil_rev_8_21_14_0_20_44_7]